MDDDTIRPPPTDLSFPVLPDADIHQVAQTILHLFDPSTAGNPALAKQLQHDLQAIQAQPEAWGLIAGLAGHEDANVRFFSAHTAQVKIARDWESLPTELQPSLLHLLLQTLSSAISPASPASYQPANAVVVRKLFGCLAALLLRLPAVYFQHPIQTVLAAISNAIASGTVLPPSLPASGTSTPVAQDSTILRNKARLWALEWCSICVEEVGRAGLNEARRNAVRRQVEADVPAVMDTMIASMDGDGVGSGAEAIQAAEAACRCAESWIGFGLAADELTSLLPHLFQLLPLPAASSAIAEVCSESIFKYGKGTKVLTEPLIAWTLGPSGHALLASAEGEPSEEVLAFTKMLAALIDHSSEWLVTRLEQGEVQNFLSLILRLTGWQGVGGVEENISELTLPMYPLLQEAIMDSEIYSTPHETSPAWAVAKSFFMSLVAVTRQKVRYPGNGEEGEALGGLDKGDREAFETWRRDAGEVIVGGYYILRDDMLRDLTQVALQQIQQNAPWQDIEATLHCIRYSAEAVPLGEETSLPTLFGHKILGRLSQRTSTGLGEERLRLTVVCMIQGYEEWFKFHPDHLLPVLGFLVPSLTFSRTVSRAAADSLKALCDICRNKLVQHIGAFSELHGKIGDLMPEEQTKVIEGITSVIQALKPADAIGPVQGILAPIVDRLVHSVSAAQADLVNARPLLVQSMNALTACFKGLSPSEDDIFDALDDDEVSGSKNMAISAARADAGMTQLRARTEQAVADVVQVWDGDAEVADAISSLLKQSTLASVETLISLSPLPLLALVCAANDRQSSALWLSLASTLTLRIGTRPATWKKPAEQSEQEKEKERSEDEQRWTVIANAASKLVVAAGNILGQPGGFTNDPDVAEAWFKFCSALATRFPGILVRLPTPLVEAYMSLAIRGLSAPERFSLTTAAQFLVGLLASTRFPSPLEPLVEPLLAHFGPRVLRALVLSAGSDGPRSAIPNLAELLAALVSRVKGDDMAAWLAAVLAEPGFPDPRATDAAKDKLRTTVLKSRTTKKMREALHEFALVARGLEGTTYGNATAL
ncbi:hypothetical protein Q5752_005289 [Cryptotrichosporon argae]